MGRMNPKAILKRHTTLIKVSSFLFVTKVAEDYNVFVNEKLPQGKEVL